MKISTPNSASFFSTITKSLRFEANDDQQSDKETPDGSGGDDLDAQLDSLKDEKNNQEEGGGEDDSNTDSDSSDSSLDPEDDSGDLGSDGGSDDSFGSSDAGGGSSDSSADSSDNDDQGIKKSVGSAPRKLTLYAEFNRIYNVLQESIDAIEKKPTDNSSMKNCVAQLQEILTDVKFILSNFEYRSEEDIMLHLQVVKRRTSLVLQLMQRQQKESTCKESR